METNEGIKHYLYQCAGTMAAGIVAEIISSHGPRWVKPHAGVIARGLNEIAMRPLLLEQLLRPAPPRPVKIFNPHSGAWEGLPQLP